MQSDSITPTCSFCQGNTGVKLLGCCISFACNNCIQNHACDDTLSLRQWDNRPKIRDTLKCRRCMENKVAVTCVQCHGKQLCGACSRAIHKGKYQLHDVQTIRFENVNGLGIRTDGSQPSESKRSGRKNTTDSNWSTIEDQKNQTVRTQIYMQLDSVMLLKTNIEAKWSSIVQEAREAFDKIRLELQKTQKQAMYMIGNLQKQEIQTLAKCIQDYTSCRNAYSSLQKLSDYRVGYNQILAFKRNLINKSTVKWRKVLDTVESTQYSVVQTRVTDLVGNISNLNLLQKVRTVQIGNATKDMRHESKSTRKYSGILSSKLLTPTHRSYISLVQEPTTSRLKPQQEKTMAIVTPRKRLVSPVEAPKVRLDISGQAKDYSRSKPKLKPATNRQGRVKIAKSSHAHQTSVPSHN